MGLLKLLLVGSVLLGAIALMSGVVRLLDEKSDGTVRIRPTVSRPAFRWYVARASSLVSAAPSSRPASRTTR